MQAVVVEREKLELRPDRELLSPPVLVEPYQCATVVVVLAFVAHADLEVEVDGTVAVAAIAGFPEPVGATLPLPSPLVAGQALRVRQHHNGRTSAWSVAVTVRDHTAEFPAGPPRPQVNPAPVLDCGLRTGVANLLAGGNVWITADGAEVGRVDGCAPHQGVNVNQAYQLNQRVRAHYELCGDRASPSVEHVAQPGPSPLPTPGFDVAVAGGEQLRVTNIANGARVSLARSGTPVGTFRCWGGALLVGLSPPFTVGESFSASQQLCPTSPPSGTGTTDVVPCGNLSAPSIGPVQAGDLWVTITASAPGAQIDVYRNSAQVGSGAAPQVALTQPLEGGDVVHVVQSLPGCTGHLALEVTVACVDPPVSGDPTGLDLFPVGSFEYADGDVKGSVFYPAEDDGPDQPYSERLAAVGRVPVVFMAHGNHDPADPSYLGYDYFQHSLARMGMVAVSVDCNALNGSFGGVGNIEDRAELIIDSIVHFQNLDSTPGSPFHDRLDFGRVGLMGHSRGGDAVVMVPTVLGGDVTVRAVLALAPTNFRYWAGQPTIIPSGYAYQTILPAADGDVRDNNGAQFYDQARPDPYKSQVYVHHANHNFFNRQWLNDDAAGLGLTLLPRAEHERVLDVYGCALFRSRLLGHATAAFLDGSRRPTATPTGAVFLAFASESATTVDHHDDGSGIGVNSLGLATSTFGGGAADEFPFDQVPAAFDPSFFGLTTGMVLEGREAGAGFRSEVGREDLHDREVWIRVGEIPGQPLPPDAATFDLGLEDGNGTVAWVSSAGVGGVARPFQRPDRTKTMLSTMRFPTGCFARRGDKADLSDVVAVRLRLGGRTPRPLAFDDLQLVQP